MTIQELIQEIDLVKFQLCRTDLKVTEQVNYTVALVALQDMLIKKLGDTLDRLTDDIAA
jgi:hypothetical protein